MTYRWFPLLEGNQRYCSFEECLAIASDLIHHLAKGWLENDDHLQALILSLENQSVPYAASLDYVELVDRDDFETRIHRQGNLEWVYSFFSNQQASFRMCSTLPRGFK